MITEEENDVEIDSAETLSEQVYCPICGNVVRDYNPNDPCCASCYVWHHLECVKESLIKNNDDITEANLLQILANTSSNSCALDAQAQVIVS